MVHDTLRELAFCRRAGKLVIGFDPVTESVRRGQARLLAVSEEISEKTRKEMSYLSKRYQIPFLILHESINDLWYILGKRAGVFSVTDAALAEKVRQSAAGTPLREEKE